jgi:hypothetical protein
MRSNVVPPLTEDVADEMTCPTATGFSRMVPAMGARTVASSICAGLGCRQRCLGLIERILNVTRIYLDEQVAAGDGGPDLHGHRHDLPGRLGLHLDEIDGFHGAGGLDRDGHVAPDDDVGLH